MDVQDKGIFFLVAGPSGAGKSTVLFRLLENESDLKMDISVTTRSPRKGEVDGRDYHFWSLEDFEAGVAKGDFLEEATVHGLHRYGTLRASVQRELDSGVDVIKDIDVQGVTQIRAKMPYPQSVAVFLTPPTSEDLRERLRMRGSEDPETLARRLETAKGEIRRIGDYDYLVVNDNVDDAVKRISAIRMAEHCRRSRRMDAFSARWPSRPDTAQGEIKGKGLPC